MKAIKFIEALEVVQLKFSGRIPKREIFSLAKQFQQLPVPEVVTLLKCENYDQRLGAISILDFKARNMKISSEERLAIFNAYTLNHKWIDDWGMVDRASPYVVGGYLFGKDKSLLYDLAKSNNPMERRTAIVSTYYFIRKNEIDDTFKIAEILINDSEHYVQTAVGSWIREAGKRNKAKLKAFLDQFAANMPRVTLRFAIEKLNHEERRHYLSLAKLEKQKNKL